MANLHWKPVSACDSLAGLTIASEFKSRYVCGACQEALRLKNVLVAVAAGSMQNQEYPWPRVATDSTKLTIPAQRSNPPRPRAFLSVEIRVFTGLRPFEWFGLVVKTTSPPSIFMLAAQQESTGLADVLVQWSNWKTDLLGK